MCIVLEATIIINISPSLIIIVSYTGNWSPSDYPNGTSWQPYKESGASINRDLEIVMENEEMAAYFLEVYNADWAMGKEWKPKSTGHN